MSALNLLHKRQFVAVSFPEDAEHLNPMPFEAAARMEKDLSEDLRAEGTRLLAEREEPGLTRCLSCVARGHRYRRSLRSSGISRTPYFFTVHADL